MSKGVKMAYQEKKWQNFYENAWAIRAEFMSQFINMGGGITLFK